MYVNRTTKAMIGKVQIFINQCLRRILKIWWPEIISNKDLWKMTNQEPVGRLIGRRKWTWIGHTLRKQKDHITRQALTWNPPGKCRRGRPRNTWRRSVESEMKKEGQSWMKLERVTPNRKRWKLIADGLCSGYE